MNKQKCVKQYNENQNKISLFDSGKKKNHTRAEFKPDKINFIYNDKSEQITSD